MVAWEDEAGRVEVAFNTPDYLAGRCISPTRTHSSIRTAHAPHTPRSKY